MIDEETIDFYMEELKKGKTVAQIRADALMRAMDKLCKERAERETEDD